MFGRFVHARCFKLSVFNHGPNFNTGGGGSAAPVVPVRERLVPRYKRTPGPHLGQSLPWLRSGTRLAKVGFHHVLVTNVSPLIDESKTRRGTPQNFNWNFDNMHFCFFFLQKIVLGFSHLPKYPFQSLSSQKLVQLLLNIQLNKLMKTVVVRLSKSDTCWYNFTFSRISSKSPHFSATWSSLWTLNTL